MPTEDTFLARLMRGEDLNRYEAEQLLQDLLREDLRDVQIAATLAALSTKGETIEELAGMASALRKRAVHINCSQTKFIDTAGTGSSAAKTFNISTAAAFVIAGAGLPVAKHGNRAASSRSGSADVLTSLGVNIAAAPQLSERCLEEIGICFMFAPLYHQATARVAAVRRELGVQTTFNLLGPLSNPAGARFQIVGVWRRDLVEKLALTLSLLGTERAWVVHGEDGLDEITLNGKTLVAQAEGASVRTFEVGPADFGFLRSSFDELRGGDADANAAIIREVLNGTRKDEARHLVLINAAAALYVAGVAPDLHESVRIAERSIDCGAALNKLEKLVELTNK